jgi:hypothetical protein
MRKSWLVSPNINFLMSETDCTNFSEISFVVVRDDNGLEGVDAGMLC